MPKMLQKILLISIILVSSLAIHQKIYAVDCQTAYNPAVCGFGGECRYSGTTGCSSCSYESASFCGGDIVCDSERCVIDTCVPNGSCDASAPSCEQTTNGVDNCGNPCSKTGETCSCTPHACDAPFELLGCGPGQPRQVSGSDGCGMGCDQSILCDAYPTPPYGTPYATPAYGTPQEYGYPTPAYGTPTDYPTPSYPTPAVTYTLTTTINSGTGTLSASGISCPGDCSQAYNDGTWVTLTATPSAGFTFGSWTGYCAGAANPCSILMNADHVGGVAFNVVVPFNYSLSNDGNVSVTKGSSNVYVQDTITKTLLAGATESVTLTLSGVPSGTSYAISNSTCSPTCTSTITFTIGPSTPVGTHTITVTGAPLSKTTSFTLRVFANPFNVVCSVSPMPALLGENVTWTGTVNGGVSPYTYSWFGTNIPTSPAPSTNPYTLRYTTIGPKIAMLTVTDHDGTQSTCPALVGAGGSSSFQVNFNPAFEEF